MSSFIYKTFKEAIEFAKRMAKEGLFVKVVKIGNEFEVTETKNTTQSKTTQIQNYSKKDYSKLANSPQKPYLAIPPERNPRNMGESLNSDKGSPTKKFSVFKGTNIPKPDHKKYIDEGIAGTRSDNKKMRAKMWSEIKNRK